MARAHLKDIFSRDMSCFSLAQGATTKVYPLRYSEEEATLRQRKTAIFFQVAGIFMPRYVAPSSQCIKHSFLAAPSGTRKFPATRLEAYF